MILKGFNIYDMTMNWEKFGCNASSATRATGWMNMPHFWCKNGFFPQKLN